MNRVSWFIFTVPVSIAVLIAIIVSLFGILWRRSFPENELFCCCCPPKLLLGVWGRPWRKGLYFVLDVFFNFSKLGFFDLEMCQMFSWNFFPNKFLPFFSGEALSLPSAFVYFAVATLLVPTACKIFCIRIWNLMLVSAATQFVLQTPEFLLSQPPLNPFGIIWLTQLQSKFLITVPSIINLDLEFCQERCQNWDPSASSYL